jgi:hypothetical protein
MKSTFAHARPKMTRSRSELAPSLLAPCTEADAASPAAYKPCNTVHQAHFKGMVSFDKDALKGLPSVAEP